MKKESILHTLASWPFIFSLLLAVSACQSKASPLPTPIPTAVPIPLHTLPPTNSSAAPTPPLLPTATPLPLTPTGTPVVRFLDPATTITASLALSSPTAVSMPSPTPLTPTSNTLLTTIPFSSTTIIGYSVQARPIYNYTFNNGPIHVLFVGGIHGGYEWNTTLLAYEIIDHLTQQPDLIPDALTVHIIPSANPDGQYLITNQTGRFTAADVVSDTVPGRFNANQVDLNRNWDCEWSPTAVWRDKPVSGGIRPFSEPENIALRDFILDIAPVAVIFWHSAADGVFAAGCPGTHTPSLELATIYGQAANYPVFARFNSYAITGDAGDWLTTQGIPSITIELRTHQSLDLNQNLAGLQATFTYLSQP